MFIINMAEVSNNEVCRTKAQVTDCSESNVLNNIIYFHNLMRPGSVFLIWSSAQESVFA